MGQTERQRRLRHSPGRLVKNVAAEHRPEQLLIERSRAPTYRRAEQIGQVTDRQRLRMTAITPVRIEETYRAVFSAGVSRLPQIRKGIIMPANQRHPGRGAGADIKRHFRFREQGGLAFEWMIGFVAPVQCDYVVRQFFDQFGIVKDDVAPEHHLAAASGYFPMNLFEKIEINAALAFCLAKLAA